MKIGIVAPYLEFATLAQNIAANMGQQVAIKVGILEAGVKAAQKLQAENAEAIIARAPSAFLMKENVDIPVIIIEITNYDIICALHDARKMGENIVFIDYKRPFYGYQLPVIEKILGLSVKHIQFSEIDEVEGCVARARAAGANVIVATASCVNQHARKIGLPCILVHTNREDFIAAINNAKTTIEVRRKEIEKAKWEKAILDNSHEGIITVNSNGKILLFNKAAEKITGLDAREVVGCSMRETGGDLLRLYGDGMEEHSAVLDIRRIKVAVNRTPIHVADDFKGMVINFQRISDIQELEGKIRKSLYTKGLIAKASFVDIVARSACMVSLKEKANKYGRSRSTVLICGESGTGKELFAQSMHRVSPYRSGPFLAVNCASLPANLLESELFGYEEGAFTGARKGGKPGLFELAHTGTIFLDEIGEMSLPLQSRLLRVLQQREVIRLGGDRIIPVDMRIICATNRDLADMVSRGTFREDLFYRINVLSLLIPPLRERKEDIPVIARKIFEKNTKFMGRDLIVDNVLFDELTHYDWPGNVRELETFIERIIALTEGKDISYKTFRQLFAEIGPKQEAAPGTDADQQECIAAGDILQVRISTMDEMEKQIINQMYKRMHGDKERLIKVLGMSRTTLWRRFKS